MGTHQSGVSVRCEAKQRIFNLENLQPNLLLRDCCQANESLPITRHYTIALIDEEYDGKKDTDVKLVQDRR